MKIVAVIATYNRCSLLKRAINAVQQQTLKIDEIVVVNNASNDGTLELLESYHDDKSKFTIITMPNNIGGAGAFYVGMEYAMKLDPDCILLQDDDGYLDPNCVEHLVNSMGCLDAVTPIIVDEKDFTQLAFDINGNTELEQFLDKETLPNILKPFNGLLLKAEVVQKIGLPIKKYFIWGDETEFRLRMEQHKFNYGTVVNARMFHPKNQLQKVKVLGHNFIVPVGNLRTFCFYRNYLHIYKSYEKFSAGKLFFKYLLFNIYTFNIVNLKLLLMAIFDVIRNDFSQHEKFLK